MATDLDVETVLVPHLRTQFERGSAVLFTGAGFSIFGINVAGTTLPSAPQLTKLLWDLCFPREPLDATTQLQDIYDTALQMNRAATEALMRRQFTVNAARCPHFYRQLLSMPWARIYTLNVDDLAEKVLSDQRLLRPLRSVSATSGRVVDAHDGSLPIVHLNGALDDLPTNVTFGRSQYAVRRTPDQFYELLRHDLVSRSVVFIGSTLEESSLWQHLEMRGDAPGGHGERDLRPRSYLVTPDLNRTKRTLLSRYKVEWLKMTTEDFCNQLIGRMDEARAEGNALLARRYRDLHTREPKLLRIAELPPPRTEPTEYLLGAEPEWADAQMKRIAHRACVSELLDQIRAIRAAGTGKRFLIVSGTAGTGKSSAMMVSALQLEADGLPVGWIDGIDRFDIAALREIMDREKTLATLFISNADMMDRWLSRLARECLEISPRIVLICECRSSKLDRIIDRHELHGIEPLNYVIPFLKDEQWAYPAAPYISPF